MATSLIDHESMSLLEIEDLIERQAPRITSALQYACRPGIEASDVHFRTGEHPWVKIGGLLLPVEELEVASREEIELAIAWLGGTEVGSTVTYPLALNQRWRGQTLKENRGPGVSLRRLPDRIPEFDDLGENLDKAREVATLGEGLVIVTGATGSGKSTTLAAIINLINETRACHILTIENPIELEYQSIRALFTQREVGTHVESPEIAFKSALRTAPDVILLSEARDEDEFDLCLEAAMSGHLVLTTMHARDAGTVFERIIGNKGKLGASKLAQAYRMVISQRLIPSRDDSKVRHVYAEIVPRESSLVNMIRQLELSKINGHIANAYSGGLDGQLAAGVVKGDISESAAVRASIDPKELHKRMESMPRQKRRR